MKVYFDYDELWPYITLSKTEHYKSLGGKEDCFFHNSGDVPEELADRYIAISREFEKLHDEINRALDPKHLNFFPLIKRD